MKTKLLILTAVGLVLFSAAADAGWRRGYWGPYGGGYYRPYRGWYGGGWGWWGPSIGISLVAPPPVYRTRTVYVDRSYQGAGRAYQGYSDSTVAEAQTRLTKLGYYPGPIDGDFGPMTGQAVRSFQADSRLPVTGRLDNRTLSRLGL